MPMDAFSRPADQPPRSPMRLGVAACLCIAALVCTPGEPPRAAAAPMLDETTMITTDGQHLPINRWGPEDPRAVLLALHGFTEHRGVFRDLAGVLADAGIAVYAYDQRGFGETDQRGLWAGESALVTDARDAWRLLRERYPDRPVHVLGESMGGAVALLATHGPEAIRPASLILQAPAVWARETMPWYQRVGLWLGDHVVPGLRFSPLTGRRIADIQPTDNPAAMAELRTDERMLRDVRSDMLAGVTDLMDAAIRVVGEIPEPALVLYGLRDEVIPPVAACRMLERIEASPGPAPVIVLYPDGYHLLTRDLQAHRTRGDIAAWIREPGSTPPSGLATTASEAADRVCRQAAPRRIERPLQRYRAR